jgi:hypothetical protein
LLLSSLFENGDNVDAFSLFSVSARRENHLLKTDFSIRVKLVHENSDFLSMRDGNKSSVRYSSVSREFSAKHE